MLTLLWASGLPLFLGVQVWTEQLLIAAVGLAMGLAFLTRSVRGAERAPHDAPWSDRLLALGALGYGGYLTAAFPDLSQNVFYEPRKALIVASIGLALLLETLRRAVGWPLIVILGALCLYALFADRLTGPLQSKALPPARIVTFAILDSASMAGAALTIAVVVVVPYVILARLLMRSGGSAFFADLSVSLLGGARGGAAKIAVLGSAFFGAISGSAVSNVASTGGITIPLMQRAGYRAKTAAAIEATASTGGQLVPPIMGASAFLLAENLRAPYSDVVTAALIPAVLFYLALLAFADFDAARRGIAPAEGARKPILRVLGRGWFILAPFAILIAGLFAFNLRPETAALLGLLALFLISLATTYEGGRLGLRDFGLALADAGRSAVEVVLICAVAGIVIGLFNLSGLSFGLTFFLVQVGKSSLLALLLLTALLCIVLGMGLPTVGVYLLLAALAAPPLIQLGVDPMAAHMYVLYFGMMSMITPPVAIAAFVAANMAKAPPMATGLEAVRIGWVAFIAPLLFVGSPALLLADPSVVETALVLATAALGITLVTGGVAGWLRRPLTTGWRALAILAGAAVLIPHGMLGGGWAVNLAGLALGGLIWRQAGAGAIPAEARHG